MLLSRLALPRVASIFVARRGRVEGDLEAAAKLPAESQAAIEAYEKAALMDPDGSLGGSASRKAAELREDS